MVDFDELRGVCTENSLVKKAGSRGAFLGTEKNIFAASFGEVSNRN